MSSPRPTTKFRLAAAALGGASRAEPRFPPEIQECPIAVAVSMQSGPAGTETDRRDAVEEAAAAVREALSRERGVFCLKDTPADADIELTITRASRQPSFDFWETRHAHARLVVRRTGEVLDTGSDYVEGRDWGTVASTLVFLVKLQCAEHYRSIVRSRREAAVAAAPASDASADPEAGPLDVDPSMLSDEHLRGLLERLRGRTPPRRR